MPIESITRIMARIKKANPSRPISIFVVDLDGKRQLDAIYGNTIESKRRETRLKPFHHTHQCPTCGHIEQFLAEEWLGNFHNEMSVKDVRAFLTQAMETKDE